MVQPKGKGEVQENLGAIGLAGHLPRVAWTHTLGGNPVGEEEPALFHQHGAASFRPSRSAPCETRRLRALESDQTGQSLTLSKLLRISPKEAFKPKQPQDWVSQSKHCTTVKHLARGVTLQDRLIFHQEVLSVGHFISVENMPQAKLTHQEITRAILCRLILNDIIIHKILQRHNSVLQMYDIFMS